MPLALTSFRRGLRAATPAIALGTAALTAALAACSDSNSPTGPVVASARTPQPVGPAYATASTAASQVLSQTQSGDTTVTTLQLGTSTGQLVAQIGNASKIVFPYAAASVCDPASSSYGIGTWNSPCTAATTPIQITAKTWVDPETGKTRSSFSPALRFVPGLKSSGHALPPRPEPASRGDAIWYCPDGALTLRGRGERGPERGHPVRQQ